MNLTIDRQEKYALIKILEPKLTSNVAPELKAEVVMLHHENFKNMIFDLSDVQYCDSSGLSAILVGFRMCRDQNGTFVLTGVQDHVRKLISISQLDTMLTQLPTVNEAIDLIFMEEVEKQLHKE
ncbi:MAG: STAS domain-containing protein [Bacteroidetes bacterium]|nr:STAS domain-containing protein [Bacteroidota bacterium]MBK6839056.1 STAS domain-containing protein [Bacteroidota bacterium]MBK9525743.1 STAS domain-containing protein [Bacteroidota bacterium]MBK9540692.1 STAS domain-containing protein [Bacteroidota bacterium]MBP6403316.1 STAS domain-containing protein [Bacteroidia bacterium]